MDLWIRSQDREKLVRPTNLKIEYENELYVILSKCNYRYRLGYYKTKERALEVLDEIQRILMPKGILKLDMPENEKEELVSHMTTEDLIRCQNVEMLQQLDIYVYEMPLE